MPHLSPMSWTIVSFALWLLILSASSFLFFLKPLKFHHTMNSLTPSSKSQWLW